MTKILNCCFRAVILLVVARNCCEAEQVEVSEATGRQLVARWSDAIQKTGRTSVHYEKHEYNQLFEYVKLTHGFCAFDGAGRWLVREESFTDDELKQPKARLSTPQTRTGSEYRREAGRPLLVLVTPASKTIGVDDRLSEFIEYPDSPPSALMPENRVAIDFWDRFQRAIQLRIEPQMIFPLFIPMAQLLDHYDVRTVKETTLGTRVTLTRKYDSVYVAQIEHIDVFFRTGSDLPHVFRLYSDGIETRFFLDPPRIGDQAEIEDATFQLPQGAKCRREVENN